MTEKRMKGTKTSIQDVYARLIELIDYNTILIGHSLDCDLRALKVRKWSNAPSPFADLSHTDRSSLASS